MFGKVVPPEGDVIDGKFIPGGTVIGGTVGPLMRAHCYWGQDSNLFRPERFLEVDDQQRATLERIVEMAFGYGRLKCAGQPVAFMELNKVFFEVGFLCRCVRRSLTKYWTAISTLRFSACKSGATMDWRVLYNLEG